MFRRIIELNLPQGQSAFLWGARQTGKSSFLRSNFPNAIFYDLLDSYELIRLSKSPWLLKEELLARIADPYNNMVIIDEIQKVPELLNDVHWLIENKQIAFILCGSSARKLKTSSTNLLGGRAWPRYFYPLVYPEIPKFDLLRALQHGLLPRHYLAEPEYIQDFHQAYVDVYLTDEIRNEGLVRNLGGFARFLDVAGLSNTEMINISNIARDCGIDRLTVQNYFQILVDTLLGYLITPYNKKQKRDLITAQPKFYFFDVGIANYLGKRHIISLQGSEAGKSFEHYMLMELMAYLHLRNKRKSIHYWRTKTGLEVDFIIGDAEIALEIKISKEVHKEDLKGIIAFTEEHPKAKGFVVSQDHKPRILSLPNNQSLTVLPWQVFLEKLWQDEII